MTIDAIVILVFGSLYSWAIIGLLIRVSNRSAEYKRILLGNGSRGLVEDVRSNRRHINELEKGCASNHNHNSDGGSSDSGSRATVEAAVIERVLKGLELRMGAKPEGG